MSFLRFLRINYEFYKVSGIELLCACQEIPWFWHKQWFKCQDDVLLVWDRFSTVIDLIFFVHKTISNAEVTIKKNVLIQYTDK